MFDWLVAVLYRLDEGSTYPEEAEAQVSQSQPNELRRQNLEARQTLIRASSVF